jgi:hypothetical protein
MSKKDFKGGLDSLLQPSTAPEPEPEPQPQAEPQKRKKGRPKTATRKITKSSQENTREGETRATFIMSQELQEKIKAIAYYDRKRIKEVAELAFTEYLDRWETANGKIKTRPQKVREQETYNGYTPKY